MTYITECATNHRLRFSPGSEFNGTMEIRVPHCLGHAPQQVVYTSGGSSRRWCKRLVAGRSETSSRRGRRSGKGKLRGQQFLPIVFHNLKCYDSHFIIKHFAQKYVERHGKDEKITYDDVKVVPISGEKYLQFQIGNLRLLNSFQFLYTSLDNLVSLLLKSGKENFANTSKCMGDDDIVFSNSVFVHDVARKI